MIRETSREPYNCSLGGDRQGQPLGKRLLSLARIQAAISADTAILPRSSGAAQASRGREILAYSRSMGCRNDVRGKQAVSDSEHSGGCACDVFQDVLGR
jgi:hypothetical protein